MVTLKRVQLTNPTITTSDINRIQDAIQDALNQIASPFIGGNVVQTILLTSGQDNLIPHRLGRIPQVWTLTDQNTNATVWSPPSTQLQGQTSNANFINLRCSSTCTISFWVN